MSGVHFTVVVWLFAAVAALVSVAIALWTAPLWLVPRIGARSPRCLYSVPTVERVVALTIDDGPDPNYTRAILDVLREHDAHATLFFISSRVPGNEVLVAAAVAEGHELGNHLTHDEPSNRLRPDEFATAIREADDVLGRFGTVRWLRPGSGWYTDVILDAIEREGHRCALGSIYPYDAHHSSARLSAAYVLSNVRPGAVIILHDGGNRGRRTVEVLRRALPVLRARGYRVVSLSELVAGNPNQVVNASTSPSAVPVPTQAT